MSKGIEEVLEGLGLRRVSELSEILDLRSFIVDSSYVSANHFAVYPTIPKRLNLAKDVLNLYGVHWRYIINSSDLSDIRKEDGDTEIALRRIRYEIKGRNYANYKFTQRGLNEQKKLWVFTPNTEGWNYYLNVLMPRFSKDCSEYERIKKSVKGV